MKIFEIAAVVLDAKLSRTQTTQTLAQQRNFGQASTTNRHAATVQEYHDAGCTNDAIGPLSL